MILLNPIFMNRNHNKSSTVSALQSHPRISLTVEQRNELAKFPSALRALVEAELAVGNSIVAVENGFPAAPCGASVKLRKAVKAERRKSVGEIKFYARNNASHAGEFTTEQRHFFVLEPPLPPEPEPDMDAIRKPLEPKPDSIMRVAERRAAFSTENALGKSSSASSNARKPSTDASKLRRCLISTETATGVKRILHFRDKRPPHEVQFALERELMVLFTRAMDGGKLRMLARGDVNGARYKFELRFDAALMFENCYSVCFEPSWAHSNPTHHDYFRKSSDGWFTLWTRDLRAANPPAAEDGSPERYRKLAEAALKAEAHLDSVAAIQRAIVDGLKRGGRYATSHKEGGTNIYWRIDRFIRSDYGEYPDLKNYTNDAEFLTALRQFCGWEASRHAGKTPLSEFDLWKLILRRMIAE